MGFRVFIESIPCSSMGVRNVDGPFGREHIFLALYIPGTTAYLKTLSVVMFH